MPSLRRALAGLRLALLLVLVTSARAQVAHVWEKQEITLKAQNSSPSPHLSVDVWVDLAGPGFNKRVCGFWDGETNAMIRMPKTPTDDDWGMRLALKNVVNLGDGPAPPAEGTAEGHR